MMPYISVIVPVFNAESTLKKCIDSILVQNFTDFEVILIDDGSQDKSLQICEDFAKKDNRVIVVHKENGGVSSARNYGLEIAKGKWVTFIDSDDYISKGFLSFDDMDTDLIFCSYANIINAKKCGGFSSKIMSGFTLSNIVALYGDNTILRGPCAKMYKRSIIGQIRFPESMKVGEDTYFVWKYLSRCKTYDIVPQNMYYVRFSTISSSQKYGMKVDYAINSLYQLKAAFTVMAEHLGINRQLFFSFIGYFKLVSSGEWKKNRTLWYDNETIKELYHFVWPDLSITQKIKLVISCILKK